MSFLSRLKISQRLAIAFAFPLVLFVGVQLLGASRAAKINESTVAFADNIVPSLAVVYKVRQNFEVSRRFDLQGMSHSADPERRIEAHKSAQKQLVTGMEQMAEYDKYVVDDEDAKLLAEVRGELESYAALVAHTLRLAEDLASDPMKYEEYLDQILNTNLLAFRKLAASADRWWQHNEVLTAKLTETSRANNENVKHMIIVSTVVVLIACALMGWFTTRAIISPLREAVAVAEAVKSGDLRSQIQVRSTDETGQLMMALKAMNEQLGQIVGQVRLSSDSIATGSTQIAMGNADLSQRTEEQASNLEQTAASMEELSSTIMQNSDTARQAVQIASGASQATTQGGEVVQKVVHTMGDISQSSRKISDIISVIDGIAFQTNILALNAAVEAARAGEQGRGFAVVAGEVRTLAQRSANAAKEIKTLISESVDKVEAGATLVNQAGQQMQDIVYQVRRVTDLIAEIATATHEQSTGVTQVSEAVSQLDQVTQQNAALVEESAAASESLKQQAKTLADVVSVFKV